MSRNVPRGATNHCNHSLSRAEHHIRMSRTMFRDVPQIAWLNPSTLQL